MAKYYYRRYLVVESYSEKLLNDVFPMESAYVERGYEQYNINSTSGTFKLSGSYNLAPTDSTDRFRVGNSESDLSNSTGNATEGTMLLKFRRIGVSLQGESFELIKNYSAGAFVDEFVYEEGTYPTNGMQGNYWYVRGDRYTLYPSVRVNGAWKEPTEGYVKVDGVWRPVIESYVNVNGVWKIQS